MNKHEFETICAGVGVRFDLKTLRIYRNNSYSHQIAYVTIDWKGNIQRVILLDTTSELGCYKALRTLAAIHGLPILIPIAREQ